MFWTVFTFEIAYWFRRPLTMLFFALPGNARAERDNGIFRRRQRVAHQVFG